jgi:hypothetical protein
MVMEFANEGQAQAILVPQISYLGVGSQFLANISCLVVNITPNTAGKRLVFVSPLFTRIEVLKVCREGKPGKNLELWPIRFDCSQWPNFPVGDYKINLRNVLVSAFRNWISVSYVSSVQ